MLQGPLLLLLLLPAATAAIDLADRLPIWPRPRSATVDAVAAAANGLLVGGPDFEITFDHVDDDDVDDDDDYNEVARRAAARYETRLRAVVRTPSAVDSADDADAVRLIRVTVADPAVPLSLGVDESYRITLLAPPAPARLLANTTWGALRGLDTLASLAATRVPNGTTIDDAPRYPHRGILIDAARHFLPMDALERTVRAMEHAKLNVLHFHVVDAQSFPFESQSNPTLSQAGAYDAQSTYSPEQIARLVEYARDRGVVVVPEFDTPGHTYAWGLGFNDDGVVVCGNAEPWTTFCAEPPCGQLDVSNERVYHKLLDGLWKDVAAAFRSRGSPVPPPVHLGGDEVNSACYWDDARFAAWATAKAGMARGNTSAILDYHFARVFKILRRHGLLAAATARPMMWEGSLLGPTSAVSESVVSRDAVTIQTWLPGSAGEAVRKGFTSVVDSNYEAWYLDCGGGNWVSGETSWCAPFKSWQTVWAYSPQRNNSLDDVQARRFLRGGEVAVWGERVDWTNLDTKAWPRASAAAERLWSDPPASARWQDALPRLMAHRARLVRDLHVLAAPLQPRFCRDGGGPSQRCPWPAPAPPPPPPTPPTPPVTTMAQRGITFTNGKYCPNITFASEAAGRSLRQLADTGASHVAIVVSLFQRHHNSTEIVAFHSPGRVGPRGYYTFVTATDAEVEAAIDRAHALGLQVMLKPQIDLYDDNASYWRGSIGQACGLQNTTHSCQRFWNAWFESYGAWLVHFARLAARKRVAQLSVSCELVSASPQATHWRRLIGRVRRVFNGALTDAANWGYLNATGGEIFNKTWWDAVDYIGVDAYWPIAGNTHAARVAAWGPILRKLEGLSRRFDRPLLFTEIGYCKNCSTRAGAQDSAQENLAFQDDHYRAALAAVRPAVRAGWFRGMYFWSWNTDPAGTTAAGGCITPQGKPAEQTLTRTWGGRGADRAAAVFEEVAVCACTV